MTIDGVTFNEDLETILNELVRQLRANDIPYIQKMVPTSTHVQICCPYHSDGLERRPSAGIRREDGLMHCFACKEVHSLPEVISHCFGKDSTGFFGWNWLLKNFASVEVEDRKAIQLDYTRGKKVSRQETFVTEEELDSYRYVHPYMYKRRLTDEVIEMFDVGYDSRTDCITFPVRDINGNTLFIARRSTKTKLFNYPQGVEKPVYGLYEINRQALQAGTEQSSKYYSENPYPFRILPNEIIICESIIDALTCWVYGKPAVALNGLGTDKQFKELNDFPCRKYILATDMDDAGMKARARIKKALKGKIVTEYLWDLNIAKDINDMEVEYFQALQEYF